MGAGLLALPAAAQWKWRDATGNVQYSDRPPPPGVADKDVLMRPRAGRAPAPAPAVVAASAAASAPSAAAAPAAKLKDPELEARRQKAEQEDAARKKADEERLATARADNCERAKSRLKAVEDGQRLARVNAKGEYEVLDDKQRAEEAKRTRDVMARDCK